MTIQHQREQVRFSHSFPDGKPITAKDGSRLGIIALIFGGIYYLYHFYGVTDIGYNVHRSTRSVFYWLFDRWRGDWNETLFANSHWIPFISIILVWMDRRTLYALSKRTHVAGLILIVLSLLLHWAGAKSEQTRLSILSLIGLSWSIPFFIYGWPVARRLIFPCGFLLFSLPLNFFDAAASPLRTISASIATVLLSGLGIDVTRAGSTIVCHSLDGFMLDLTDSRSGIFAVTAVFAYSFLCAYVTPACLRYRILLAISGIPLLMLSNIVRGMAVVIIAAGFGEDAGTAFNRYFSGPLICLGTFGALTLMAMIFFRRSAFRSNSAGQQVRNYKISTPTSHLPWLTTLAVIVLAGWWIPRNLDVTDIDEAGVNLTLPAVIGPWQGGPLFFCYNHDGEKVFSELDAKIGDPCPLCGMPLHEMSQVEKNLLPADTIIRKNRYSNPSGQYVFFTTVLSGKKRSSIHRPEVCLVGPGSEITRSYIHPVTLNDGKTLNVKILEMILTQTKPGGKPEMMLSYYAYWFVGIDRETPYHIQRMIWMASDRLFRNQSYRWAYISIGGRRAGEGVEYLAEIDAFLRSAYPFVRKTNPDTAVED